VAQSKPSDLGFYGRLTVVILVTVALSEAIPEIVNTILLLILIGLILGHYQKFSYMTQLVGSIGK